MLNDGYKVVFWVDKRPAGTHERTFNAPKIDEVASLFFFCQNMGTRNIKQSAMAKVLKGSKIIIFNSWCIRGDD